MIRFLLMVQQISTAAFSREIVEYLENESFAFALVKVTSTAHPDLTPVYFIYRYMPELGDWANVRNGREEKMRVIYNALIS